MNTRPAYVAGQFYPDDPHELRRVVARYIDNAALQATAPLPKVMIAPHAGYIFSGPTAGYAYARIRNASPGRVVLLGVSHHRRFDGISFFNGHAFQSPLGDMPLDTAFLNKMAAEFPSELPQAHEYEHTLEVHIPFIQEGMNNTLVAPLLFGARAGDFHVEFGRRLADILNPDDIVIASTDLSHFLSEKEANAVDRHTIEIILSGDIDRLIRELRNETCSMCGGAAVVAALACAAAQDANTRILLDYRTSAQVSGDYGRVVGYAAIAIEQDKERS